jgi:histidyl-tRNA synthetase
MTSDGLMAKRRIDKATSAKQQQTSVAKNLGTHWCQRMGVRERERERCSITQMQTKCQRILTRRVWASQREK